MLAATPQLSPSPCLPDLLRRPVSELTFVAFDTETTGRHPIISRMLEISAIKFKGNGAVLEKRTQLINPEQTIPPDVIAIHGITENMVAEMPKYEEVIPSFMDWMSHQEDHATQTESPTVLVAHNAAFDVGFLQVALSRMKMSMPPNAVLDTLSLSRKLIQDSKNHKLRTLIEHIGFDEDVYHRAEADSKHVMNLFLHLLDRLGPKCTLQELIDESGAIFFKDPISMITSYGTAKDLRIKQIGAAIESGLDLQIHYKGFGIKNRKITPLSVMLSGKKYYLVAHCHAVDGERIFRINRIVKMEAVERIMGASKC